MDASIMNGLSHSVMDSFKFLKNLFDSIDDFVFCVFSSLLVNCLVSCSLRYRDGLLKGDNV